MLKQRIEEALRPLVGEPLTDMWRYAGCQKFEFGVQRPERNRKGEAITRADLGLVVSCDWRVVGPKGCAVSSGDFTSDAIRTDNQDNPFYALIRTSPPTVEQIEADETGTLRIRMAPGYTLEVLPIAGREPSDEQWRLMPADEEQPHIVLGGDRRLSVD